MVGRGSARRAPLVLIVLLVLAASSAANAGTPGPRGGGTPADVTRLFVHAAVQRQHPARAWGIVAPALKIDTTRAEWNAGWMRVVPVLWPTPLLVRTATLVHRPSSLLLHVGLRARGERTDGHGVFLMRLVLRHERWLVSYWGPAAAYSAPRGEG
jgi:hypothetical protein